MALYFLHLRDGTDEVLDPQGKEFATMDALRSEVLISARDIMSADIRRGVLDLRFRIDAETESGELVYTFPFKHAFNIIPGEV